MGDRNCREKVTKRQCCRNIARLDSADNKERQEEKIMQLMPLGDHYVWYCEWCDTRNVTLWVRVEGNRVCCAACHKTFSVFEETRRGVAAGAQSFHLL